MPETIMSHIDHKDSSRSAGPGSVRDIANFILGRNQEQSLQYCNPAASLARRQYRSRHSTEIVVLKCMDGRLNLSVMTETPVGILHPYRNIGGRFDLGWPYLGLLMEEWVNYAVKRGRDCLVMASYHYSKGDKHRGCKGFGYDTEAARAAAKELVDQYGRVFGKPYTVIHPILIGIETDEDALVFHGEHGEVFSVAEHTEMTLEELNQVFESLYPSMKAEVRYDLLELVQGNQRRIKQIRADKREPIDLDHREQIIAVGRGFDWLHQPNLALIIGPYSPDWASAVETAGRIVLDNIERGQLDKDAELLLLVSALSRDRKGDVGWNLASEKARFMTTLAQDTLQRELPELMRRGNLSVMTGVVDAHTRLLHRCS